MLRWLLAILLLVLGLLQYRLWIAEGSLAEMKRLQRQVVEQTAVNQELQARNAVLETGSSRICKMVMTALNSGPGSSLD